MLNLTRLATLLIVISLPTLVRAQEIPEAPKAPEPEPQHAWLQQLAGEWEGDGTLRFGPDVPSIKSKGTQKARKIGNFWVVADISNDVQGQTGIGLLTLGYNTEKKHFVGTWIDSMTNMMWRYEGQLDDTGKILTLNTKGPSFENPNEMADYRDRIEMKSKDHQVFTSSVKMEDGSWYEFMNIQYHRKK